MSVPQQGQPALKTLLLWWKMQLKRNLRIWNKCQANRDSQQCCRRGMQRKGDTKEGGIFLLSCGTEQSGRWSVSVQPKPPFPTASGEVSLRGLLLGEHLVFCPERGWLSWQIQRGKRWGNCLFSLTCTFVGLKYNLTGFQLQPPVQSLSRARRGKKKLLLCFMWKITCSVTPESPIHAKLHYPLKYVPCALPNALVSVFLFSYALLTCL